MTHDQPASDAEYVRQWKMRQTNVPEVAAHNKRVEEIASRIEARTLPPSTAHSDATDRKLEDARVKAISEILWNAGIDDAISYAEAIITADPLTAEYERAVAGKAHWEQREADNWVKLQALVAQHKKTAALLGEYKTMLMDVRDGGLVYWEPNTIRGVAAQAKMLSAISDLLSRIEESAK